MQALGRDLLVIPKSYLSKIFQYRTVLFASTRVELAKRYSGSLLGHAWLVVQPMLLLSIYLFVYLVVFQSRFPGQSQWEYVLFVFSGLIPYLGFSEALNTSCVSIRQNYNLINNVLLPIELIPVRSVLISLCSQAISLGLLVLLVIGTTSIRLNLLWLPVLVFLEFLMLLGLGWFFSALAVLLPDVSYFLNHFLVFLMFVSPIGFKPEMVPAGFKFMIELNPISYMVDAFRNVFIENKPLEPTSISVFLVFAVACFVSGSVVFSRFKDAVVDF